MLAVLWQFDNCSDNKFFLLQLKEFTDHYFLNCGIRTVYWNIRKLLFIFLFLVFDFMFVSLYLYKFDFFCFCDIVLIVM